MTRILIAFLAAATAGCTDHLPGDPTGTVREVLSRSAAAWNHGDLEAFVGHYVADTATTFVADGRVHRGFSWIRDRYASAFRDTMVRDSLRFADVHARPLGDDFILATARYILSRDGVVRSAGPFTLVLQRRQGSWKIIHDHTSRDD